MKNIKPITLLLIITGIVCFFTGWSVKNMQYNKMKFNYEIKIDSIKTLGYIREEKQSKYFGMQECEVIKILPTPVSYSETLLFDNGNLDDLHWIYMPYFNRIKNTNDTLTVHTYSWNIPYADRPLIYIVFEQKNNVWVATSCIEWDSDMVQIM